MKTGFAVLAAVFTLFAAGSAQVNNSGSASVSSSNSVSADQSGATVQSGTSADVSNKASIDSKSNNGGNNHSASNSSAALTSGTTLTAVLAKPVDSRKAKPGDEVIATASQDVKANGTVVVRKGSKLVGHVTQAEARGEGAANSSLGIMFDRAVLKNGQQVPVHGVVQALAASQAGASAAMPDDDLHAMSRTSATNTGTVRSSGGLLGGVGSTVNTTTGTVANTGSAVNVANSTTGAVAGSGRAVQGALNSSSTGVVGLRGVSLDAAAINSTQGSIISSAGKSVHLDSGTQMVLRVVNQ